MAYSSRGWWLSELFSNFTLHYILFCFRMTLLHLEHLYILHVKFVLPSTIGCQSESIMLISEFINLLIHLQIKFVNLKILINGMALFYYYYIYQYENISCISFAFILINSWGKQKLIVGQITIILKLGNVRGSHLRSYRYASTTILRISTASIK